MTDRGERAVLVGGGDTGGRTYGERAKEHRGGDVVKLEDFGEEQSSLVVGRLEAKMDGTQSEAEL